MAAIIDPWGSTLVKDYEKIIKDFGLEVFTPKTFPKPNKIMRRGVVFAGRDLKRISDCLKKKKKFYALSGIMPTAEKIHFGNKMVVENLRYFQDHGAKTYILVADLEAAATRDISLEEAQKRALNFHIPAYIALGLDPKKTIFYFQSENRKVMNLGYEFAKKVTLNEFRAIYGQADPSRIMAAVLQAGDMLFPQTIEKIPGIIPVGIDQDPHVRLCRDIISRTRVRYDFIPISSVYHKFTPGLDGGLKMSKSKPGSCIELPEDIKSVSKKIKAAKTGGRETVEKQRKLGGKPEECMIFELYKQHLINDDKELQKIYDKCKKGRLTCGEDKAHCIEHFKMFMSTFMSNLERARKMVGKLKFIR